MLEHDFLTEHTQFMIGHARESSTKSAFCKWSMIFDDQKIAKRDQGRSKSNKSRLQKETSFKLYPQCNRVFV